jgi:TolB-like protein/Tfp pilus assembly protein PilF
MVATNASWTEEQVAEAYAHLDRILASPVFSQSGRQQRFLRYIVTETLAGRAETLKGYTIGVEVFDREQAFDPAVDAIVRVEAARLRGKLREYYDGPGQNDAVRFDLPKGNYTVHIARQDQSPVQAEETRDVMLPRLIEDQPSLAILPFANVSSNPEQEYFADGFTDCLITEVSRLPGLFVISRQSSFTYKKVVKRAEEIGRELGVKYLLEGSVQRAGEWVRITAQLIDTVSGAHAWAERYDRELKDIFALQDDVTQRIATVLQVKLAGNENYRFGHSGTSSLEAHDALLHGLERFWVYTQESSEEAKAHFAEAIRLDPGYAAAHAWLARTLIFQWVVLWEPKEEMLGLAYAHARMAADLDPQLPYAYSVLGWAQCWRKEGEAAIASARRAVALDRNNADAYFFLAITLAVSDRAAEALQCVENGMRLNPHPSAFNQLTLGFCLFILGDYAQAIAAFRRGVEVADTFIPNHIWLCVTHTLLGHDEEALVERDKVLAFTERRKPIVQVIWLDEALRNRMTELVRRAGLA